MTVTKLAEFCTTCRMPMTWRHDHKPDLTGLDDGPPLYHQRKKPPKKSAEVMRDIRLRAWATRRAKYGAHGHR